jgi:hypothetical protein
MGRALLLHRHTDGKLGPTVLQQNSALVEALHQIDQGQTWLAIKKAEENGRQS